MITLSSSAAPIEDVLVYRGRSLGVCHIQSQPSKWTVAGSLKSDPTDRSSARSGMASSRALRDGANLFFLVGYILLLWPWSV